MADTPAGLDQFMEAFSKLSPGEQEILLMASKKMKTGDCRPADGEI